MNIAVCISSVPDTTSKINFTENGNKFDSSGVQFVINPYDEFGLTKAMFLKEKLGGEVTIITVGDSTAEPVIRKALAIGADKAVRINMTAKDSYSTAAEIANYLNNNPTDLIITGKESIDYNGGKVPGFVAEKLNIPFVNGCIGMEVNGEILELKREIDNGYEICESSLPSLIAGQKGLVEEKDLRIPSMRGIMTARTKPLEVIEPNEEFEENMKIVNFEKPKGRSECTFINHDQVEKLIDLLANEAKVI